MVIVMPIVVRGSSLQPYSLANAFIAVHHGGGGQQGGNLGGFLPVSASNNEHISCCTSCVNQLTVGH